MLRNDPAEQSFFMENRLRNLPSSLKPKKAEREFWTAKAFHGYLGEAYQMECSYQTVVRFFHKQGFALKDPQPYPDCQDEKKRKLFLKRIRNIIQ